jgi:predicted enzyme related to lactoylglutathione lyase
MPGRFMWYELMTTDAKAAGEFYRAVVGWKTQAMGDAYTTFHVGDANGMAGMLTLSDEVQAGGARPVWMGYVGVDDVDDYAQRLTKAGGTVHQPPADIPAPIRAARPLCCSRAPPPKVRPPARRARRAMPAGMS